MSERELFTAALNITEPAERAAWLDRECGADAALRHRIDLLLRAFDDAGSLLDRPPVADGPTVDEPTAPVSGTVIGPYKLIEQIGEGGMGTVWMAQQTEPVRRVVAVKLIKAGMDSRQVVARFEAERQALALMDHPNIAKVHDAGATPDGRPFFVMELVKGVPITRYCDDHKLTPRQRLELFVPVCQAIQHAHQKGVIHRDLKPSNVLVAEYDDRPVPKVIDFGVAKAAGQQLTEQTLHTGFGAVVGTVEYMSPEQATFNQLDIDTRSDVYSLGVLLYELLAGSPPFTKRDLERAGMLEMLRVIREQEPSKPSTKLSTADGLPTLAANRGTEPAKLTKLVRGELDWIVMKALEKDRARRYETANGFAMDVQRYLAGEAVQAVPPSAGYRLRKFARRNKGPVVAAGLVLASLMLGIIGTSIGIWRAEQRRVEMEQAKDDAVTEKKKAEEAEAQTLAEFRASTDDAIEQLIGSKPELGPQERTYLEKTLKRWQVFAGRQGDDERSMAVRGEGHVRVGYVWDKLGRRDEARNEYQTGRDLRKKLADAFPNVPDYQQKLASAHNYLGALLRDLGERDAARKEFEAARHLQEKLFAQYPAVRGYQQMLAMTRYNLGVLLVDLGERDAARREFEAARVLQEKLFAQDPTLPEYRQELARTHDGLGSLLADLGDRAAARKEHETARDLQKQLAAQHPAVPAYQQQLAAIHYNLGILLKGLGERDAARKEYEAARDLQKKLAAQYPAVPAYQQDLAKTHINLWNLLADLGERDAARKGYEAARDLQKKLAAQYPDVPGYRQELATTHGSLGLLLADLGERDAARKEYEAARDLRTKLVAQYPDVPEYRQGLAITHNCLGMLLADLRQRDEARRAYEAARGLQQKLADAFPDVPDYQRDLAQTHINLGGLLAEMRQRDEARRAFETARDLQKKLADAFPNVPAYQQDLATAHHNLGMLLAEMGQPDDARRAYEAARDLQQKLAAQHPDVPAYQRNLASTHHGLGMMLAKMGQPDDARRAYEAARDLQQKLTDAFPDVPDYQRELALTHNNLGALLADLRQRDEARRAYEAARDLQQKLTDAFPDVPDYQRELALTHNNLGILLAALGQPDDARSAYEAARDLRKKLADAFPAVPDYQQELAHTHHKLGILLTGLRQPDEARRAYEAARDLQQKLADAFPDVPAYQRDLARAHNNLGILLAEMGRRDEARRAYETARDLRKKLADAFPNVPAYQVELGGGYCNFGNLVRDEGQPADSLPWFDLAIRTLTPVHETDPRDVTARRFLRNSHYGRALAYDRLKKHAEAVKDWDRAVELSPTAEQPAYRASRATSRLLAGQVAEAVAEVAELTRSATWNARQWYDFACVYAAGSGKIADRKQEYADRAMELLRQAVKTGYKDAAHMKKDSGLDPLREREDFKQLVAELQKKK